MKKTPNPNEIMEKKENVIAEEDEENTISNQN